MNMSNLFVYISCRKSKGLNYFFTFQAFKSHSEGFALKINVKKKNVPPLQKKRTKRNRILQKNDRFIIYNDETKA